MDQTQTTEYRLKLLRMQKGLNQADVARAIGLSKAALSRYEAGERKPKANELKKLGELFDVSVDYLLCRTDVKTPFDQIEEKLLGRRELLEFWEKAQERQDLQLLLDNVSKLPPETVQRVVEIIKMFQEERKKGRLNSP